MLVTIALKQSASLPSMPSQWTGNWTLKSPSRIAHRASSNCWAAASRDGIALGSVDMVPLGLADRAVRLVLDVTLELPLSNQVIQV